jgi:DNA-binding MarR family transcriptional regulator
MKSRQPDEISFPALLRAARDTYVNAIRMALAQGGFDDIPRNGVFVIGAVSRTGAPLGQIVAWLRLSKQAAGQLVDTLVLRGYLARAVDETDRRRLTVSLTERGRAAAAVTRAVVEKLDASVAKQVGRETVAQTRATLLAIASLEQKD